MSAIESYSKEIKENPYNYPIIYKWNRKVFNKYKYQIFEEIDNNLKSYNFDFYFDFVNVNDVVAGRKIIF